MENARGACIVRGMAKKTITNGKGRVVTPAPKSAKGKNAPTKSEVAKRYADAIADAKRRGVKPPYAPSPAFLTAILRAFAVASLTDAGIGTTKGEGQARRDHARKVRAGSVTPDMVVHANHKDATEGVGVFTDRAENTVRARLQGFCKVMGYAPDTLYAVRGDRYAEGEVGGVYILRK